MTRIDSMIRQFVFGLRAPWSGSLFIMRSKQAQKIIAFPLIIIFLLFIVCLYISYSFLPPVIAHSLISVKTWVSELWPDFLSYKAFTFIGNFLLSILKILVYLALFSINLLLAWLLGNIICSFFWENLAEQILSQSPYFKNDMLIKLSIRNVLSSMLRELIKEICLLAIITLTWLMTFFPILGQTIFIITLPIITSIILGYATVDYAFSILGLSIQQRWQWAKKNLPFLLGSGVYGLFFPVVYFLYPSFIVGALLSHSDNILLHAKSSVNK